MKLNDLIKKLQEYEKQFGPMCDVVVGCDYDDCEYEQASVQDVTDPDDISKTMILFY